MVPGVAGSNPVCRPTFLGFPIHRFFKIALLPNFIFSVFMYVFQFILFFSLFLGGCFTKKWKQKPEQVYFEYNFERKQNEKHS